MAQTQAKGRPSSLDALRVAFVALRSGRPRHAEDLCQGILDRHPRDAGALQLMGSIRLDRGDARSAASYLRQAAASRPLDAATHYNLGTALIALENYEEAARALRMALTIQPELAEAWANLGAALSRQGKLHEAASVMRKALKLRPNSAIYHNNLGLMLMEMGNAADAIVHFRLSLESRPEHIETLRNLSLALEKRGLHGHATDVQAAIMKLRQIDTAQPTKDPAALVDLASLRRSEGKLDEAVVACQRAIARQPVYPEAHNMLGCLNLERHLPKLATSAFQRAIVQRPGYAEAHHNLGRAFLERQLSVRAAGACRRAIDLKPGFAEAYVTLGLALQAQGQLENAMIAYRAAIACNPNLSSAYNNLGAALQLSGHVGFLDPKTEGVDCLRHSPGNALENYERALELEPENTVAHLNKAMALLLLGDFDRGWMEYEWRWRQAEKFTGPERFTMPLWKGEDLQGRSIIIHAEQGFGDTIQFVRYATALAACGARVILECQAELADLMLSVKGISEVVRRGEGLPSADYRVPLMSLPRLLRTTIKTIPADFPYLGPRSKENVRGVRNEGEMRIGIVWAGNAKFGNDAIRSCPIDHFLELSKMSQPGRMTFYSLQVGGRKIDLKLLQRTPIVDLGTTLTSFNKTAQIILSLDLVISVDTAVAHLTGALAKPVWLVLPFSPDWRWLLGRRDSPWYPTMRLFRQPALGDWKGVFASLSSELRALTDERAGALAGAD